jgi:NTP pyrophosphatase (non-canonical NTP hydrolase)
MTKHAKTKALQDVIAEMNSQDEKWGADRDQHPFVWNTILGEEVGEVCQAILHDEFGGSHAGTAREELIQVAAVALQFIEQYDRLSSVEYTNVEKKLVILESPFAATNEYTVEENIEYARKCVRHSLSLGEAPIASHLLYTQDGILDDDIPEERQWGIDAGLAWKEVAQGSVVYIDRGISKGMEYGIKAAEAAGLTVEFRKIEE